METLAPALAMAKVGLDKTETKEVFQIAVDSTEEIKDFARLTGKNDVHKLSIHDLCTTNSEISNYTDIEHV